MSTLINFPETNRWAECIGGLILNFGLAECESFIWIRKLSGKDAEYKARKKKLSERIERIIKTLSTSSFSSHDKEIAQEHWNEIKRHSSLRNRIAHNPVNVAINTVSGEVLLTIHNLQKASAVDHDPIEELKIDKVKEVAIRMGELIRTLDSLIESIPHKS